MHSSAKMLSLLSSSYISLHLTQTTHAYIVLNTSCKKSDYKFAECVIIMLSFGYHLLQSQKQGFVFLEKSFSCFHGVQPALMGRMHVPFWGILVSKIKVLPFSGGATGINGAIACPFLGHSCFKNKWFAGFRGCNRCQWGIGMSLFGTFLFLGKSFCRNRDMQQMISAQNDPKWPKSA